MTITYAQIYCTVNDLLSDNAQPVAGSVDRLLEEIESASRTIMQEIGVFIPVTDTLKFKGACSPRLYLPPFLAITSISNDGTALLATDYITKPGERFWPNGPYNMLEVDPDAANLSEWEEEADAVEITARWGLYEESKLTGTTLAANQLITATSLQVNNGAKLSPGAVLLIGSEQQHVTGYAAPTAVTQLNGAVADTDETITVDNGALLNIGEIIRIGVSQYRIIDINGNLLYVQARWNNTNAADQLDDASVEVYRTFNVTRAVNGTTAAAHTSGDAVSRMVAPANIAKLCKKIAVLGIMQSATAYSGKSGNSQTGETYYYENYPRWDIERMRDEYSIKMML